MVEGPDGDDAIAVHHVGFLVARLGSPRVRRRVRGIVPRTRCASSSRPTTGKPSSRDATCGPVGSGSFRTTRRRRCSARCTSTPTTDYLLLQEHPHVYTLGSSAKPEHVLRDPASVGAELVAGRSRRRRHLPRPGSARRLPDRLARRVAGGPARRRRVRPQARGRADRGARRLRHRGRPVDRVTPACGSATRRSPRSACASRAAAPGTGSRSTSIPISRCSTTSSRAASATAASRRWRGCSAAGRRCTRSSTASSPRFARERSTCDVAERQDVGLARRPVRADRRAPRASRSRSRRKRPEWMHVRARFDDGYLELKQLARAARPPHRVRGGRLPEHLRVLVRSHRDLHDQRRSLHAGVRLLPGRHAQAAGARRSTSRNASPTRSPRSASRTPSSRASRATTSPTAAPPASRRRSTRSARRVPGTAVELLISDCKGDAASLGDDLRRPARRAQPQPRDGGPPAARGAPVGRLRPLARGARSGAGRRPRHQVGPHPRHGRDRRRGARPRSPTCAASASTS